jgi:2-polyprenyl-6-methoxyphenol hydroxylase-like FAD-dependent oxidoreductase
MKSEAEVLIVGAGPTGLNLALWLTRLGVKVRIIDKAAGPGKHGRAISGRKWAGLITGSKGGVVGAVA